MLAIPLLDGLAWRNIGPAVAGGRVSGVAGTDANPYLNRLDAMRRAAAPQLTRAIAAVYDRFTSSPVNSEDDMYRPDRLRERLQNLLGVIALSQGPPLPPHEREAAAIRLQFATAVSAYRAFLAAHRLAPDPALAIACTRSEDAQ